VKVWCITLRIWSLTATFVPIGLGASLAYLAGRFSWIVFVLLLVCGSFLQLATNLLNTYGDAVSGVDFDKPCLLPLTIVRRAGIGCLVAAGLLSGVLFYLTTWKLLFFAVAGMLGGAFYTSTFFKYAGWGVPGVFVLMGPLEVLASFYALTQTCSWEVGILSLPIGCLVAAVLHGNDLHDMPSDEASRIRTFSLRIGLFPARRLYAGLVLVPFPLLVIAGFLFPPFFAMLPPFLVLPWALLLSRDAILDRQTATLEHRAAGLHFLFGSLMIAGLLLFR